MSYLYGGIDNGNEGALVLLNAHMNVIDTQLMPTINVGKGRKNRWILDKVRFLAILTGWQTVCRRAIGHPGLFVVLEKAQAMPAGLHGRRQGTASTFKTGRDYGCAEMALVALGIQHEIVHPRTWQTARLKGVEGGDTKARSVLKCQQSIPQLDLYPGKKRKPHDGLADAANMAAYGMALRPPLRLAKPTKRPPPPPPKRS